MSIDFSWENTMAEYIKVYKSIGAEVGPRKKVEDAPKITGAAAPQMENTTKKTEAKPKKAETAPKKAEATPKKGTKKEKK
jgi:hypothetical protein